MGEELPQPARIDYSQSTSAQTLDREGKRRHIVVNVGGTRQIEVNFDQIKNGHLQRILEEKGGQPVEPIGRPAVSEPPRRAPEAGPAPGGAPVRPADFKAAVSSKPSQPAASVETNIGVVQGQPQAAVTGESVYSVECWVEDVTDTGERLAFPFRIMAYYHRIVRHDRVLVLALDMRSRLPKILPSAWGRPLKIQIAPSDIVYSVRYVCEFPFLDYLLCVLEILEETPAGQLS